MHFILTLLTLSCASAFAEPALEISVLQKELSQIQSAPESAERFARESEMYYYLGNASEGKTEQQIEFYEHGVEKSELAQKLEKTHPLALLMWCANRGAIFQLKKSITALFVVPKIQKKLQLLLEKHPDFGNAAADRALGNLYMKAPGFISVGSSQKARQHFEAALKRFPDYPGNQVYWAEFLYEQGQKDAARHMAMKVIQSSELAKHPLNSGEWLKIARRLID